MSNINKYNQTVNPPKVDVNTINSLGGKFLGVYDVPLSDIVYGYTHQPARAVGEDRELRRQIKSDISRRGKMDDAPTVTWDPVKGKYKPNDGNHRLQAHEELAKEQKKSLSSYKVPVAIVDWGNNLAGEIEYSHRANNNKPHKPGGKKDAVCMITNLASVGKFAGMNEKQLQKAIYKLIDANFYACCSPASKANIWKTYRASVGLSKIAQFSKRQLTQECLAHWNLPGKKFKSGQVIGKTVFINSVPTAADKAIHRAAVNVVANKSVGTEVKLLCYSNASSASSIIKERDKVLREYACCNRSLWKNNFVVSEVSFLPQIQTGANTVEPKQTFYWKPDPSDNNKMKWYDLRSNSFRTD
jgi:hypothetical protein